MTVETLLYITQVKLFIFRYLIPGAFISDLYIATLSTKFIPVEDAFTTGYELCIFLTLMTMLNYSHNCSIIIVHLQLCRYAARKIGLHPPHHDWRFSCGQMVSKTDDCEMSKMFTGHKVTPDLQYSIWETLQRHNYC